MNTVSAYYKGIFAQKVYKISLSSVCTCPNRDGLLSYGGCIFCNQDGSGEFCETEIQKAKEKVLSKMPKTINQNEQKFIAYFQNFSNTYGDLDELKSIWYKTLEDPQIVGLAIATRPDCITDECLQVLKEISKKYYVQIELGLQTCNNKTVKFINRCYKNNVYKKIIKKIHKTNKKIHVVTHIIFGLPYEHKNQLRLESHLQMLKTVKYAVNSKTDGIKITNLYVLKNTPLSLYYNQHLFNTLTLEEYIQLVQKALKIIPKNIVIHRLTGDPKKTEIISPLWCLDKKKVLNIINKL